MEIAVYSILYVFFCMRCATIGTVPSIIPKHNSTKLICTSSINELGLGAAVMHV